MSFVCLLGFETTDGNAGGWPSHGQCGNRNKIIFSNETFDGNKVMEDAIFTLWTWMRSFEALPYSYWSTNISSVFVNTGG